MTGDVADWLVVGHHDYLAAPAVRLADPEVAAARPYQLGKVAWEVVTPFFIFFLDSIG